MRYYSVPEPSKSVHPAGNPMSHSTHAGFRVIGGVGLPLSASGAALSPEGCEGLASIATRSSNRETSLMLAGLRSGPLIPDEARAVGQAAGFAAWFANCVPWSTRLGECVRSWAFGVPQNEDPVPDMRGANVGSRNAMPFAVIPERGQRPEYGVQPPSKES